LLLTLVAFALTTLGAAAISPGVAHASAKRLPPPLGHPPPQPQQPAPPPQPQYPPLPNDSGTGRRIVYSIDQQRVWIVEGDERVAGSWLVSGNKSLPDPGTYSIYSRSRWSSSGEVRMEYMLRFTKSSKGNAIGLHAIPVDKNGQPIQSEDELGQPRSHGCVRQARSDAEYLWNWAPDGTAVRVTP
jgi:lipoprotein-anchoring transpeptidase ErfK/SrfK